jgi:hypothetical protein
LLSCDLIFTTKVQTTARALGYHLEVVGDVMKAKIAIGTLHPHVIFVDLTAKNLSASDSLADCIKLAGPDVWFVAFGPHVEKAALAKAKAAGCQVVLPRSKFAQDLPQLIQFYYSQCPAEASGDTLSGSLNAQVDSLSSG